MNYEMHGKVTKVEWLTWPMALNEKFVVSVGDLVCVRLKHERANDPQFAEIVERMEYSVTIGSLEWTSDGFLRTVTMPASGDRWMDGEFPNINLGQQDFLNHWQPASGDYSHSDQSIISLFLKEGGQVSVGKIEFQGDICTSLANFLIEYKFDSAISRLAVPTINDLVVG